MERSKYGYSKEEVCEMFGHVVGSVVEPAPPEGGTCRRCGEFIPTPVGKEAGDE